MSLDGSGIGTVVKNQWLLQLLLFPLLLLACRLHFCSLAWKGNPESWSRLWVSEWQSEMLEKPTSAPPCQALLNVRLSKLREKHQQENKQFFTHSWGSRIEQNRWMAAVWGSISLHGMGFTAQAQKYFVEQYLSQFKVQNKHCKCGPFSEGAGT